MNDQEIIQEVLQGHLTAPKSPKPRLVKIFIASTKSDFCEERRQLLEVVGPELQSTFDRLGLEVELVDMHYGAEYDPCLDAILFEDHLNEIRECHRVSRGCFFLCLVGNKYGPGVLPPSLDLDQYEALSSTARDLGLKADTLDTWYNRDDVTSMYNLQQPSDVTTEEWKAACCDLGEVMQRAAQELETRTSSVKYRHLAQSAVERQFHHALGLAPGTAHHILAVTRDWEKLEDNQQEQEDFDVDGAPHQRYRGQLQNFRDVIATVLPEENREHLTVSWKPGGLDADLEEHDSYLNDFRECVINKLEALINKNLEDEPDIKARNKTEVYQETLSHLLLCLAHNDVLDTAAGDVLERVKTLMTMSYSAASGVRHGPVVVHGGHGSGKTSLIAAIYSQSPRWFDTRLTRIVRFSAATPRSAYNLELLRVICQQLCLLLKLSDGYLPKDASFDPLYVNNWFQTLLRRFEESSSNEVLLILIDDLHRLNPLDADIVAGLSWLPISLPRNVHIVGTTAITPEQLKLTPVQRERFRSADCYVELPQRHDVATLTQQVETKLERLEEKFGKSAISRLAGFLTCTEFGLTETELLELLMPTSNSAATLSLAAGFFNFSTLCSVRRAMGSLLREKLMSGKLLLKWRHELIIEVAKKRYLQSQDALRAAHGEIANLFFSEFAQQTSEKEEGEEETVAPASPTENKETPFQSTQPADDVTYSLRHVEESWIHLLKAGDTNRLKQLTVCRFDFLLAATQTVSASYLRCVLEHVRCYLLSRDLELVYYLYIAGDTNRLKQLTVCRFDFLLAATQTVSASYLRCVLEHVRCYLLSRDLELVYYLYIAGDTNRLKQLTVCRFDFLLAATQTVSASYLRCVLEHVRCYLLSRDLELVYYLHIAGDTNRLKQLTVCRFDFLLAATQTVSASYLRCVLEHVRCYLLSRDLELVYYLHIAGDTNRLKQLTVCRFDFLLAATQTVSASYLRCVLEHVRCYLLSRDLELVYYLYIAGDTNRLKQLTVCRFDFLLAATQTVSASYLRCVLEHVRCYLLSRDLELVYYTVRKSSDVLTRDPLQLAAQVICWLRTHTDNGQDLVSHMITSAMAWCDGYNAPLLVPLNGWLTPPLPLQIKSMHCGGGVRMIEPTPSGQHVVVVPAAGDPQLWHVMSNSLIHTFKGHSGPVLCLAITRHAQYLLTGSEDISIIVWDIKTLNLKLRIYEHIAPVLCITPALGNSVIVSGGEDSRIIITSLLSGDVVMKIDHHRGPVTSVQVNTAGDVLVSGSSDATVCLWSLENFNLLNTIALPSPVMMLDVSMDSVFLLVACEDNQLYLRSLATGTEIHCLRGHKTQIKSLCLAQDNCRAVVGGSDGKIYIFDMHSGRLLRTLTSHATEVTGVKVTENDDFLLTAGGKCITFWSFRRDDATGCSAQPQPLPRRSAQQPQPLPHTAPIACLDIARDGQVALTGSLDGLVNLWQVNAHELHSTLQGHEAAVTCVSFAPNGLFAVSGSEDTTARVWGLTLGLVVSTFKGHRATVTAVTVMMDSRRVVSSDRQGLITVWLADNATLLHSCSGPGKCLAVTNNMKYVVCGNGDNSLRIWSVHRDDEKYTVSHGEEVTCFVLSVDSLHVITGSKDMSLKVWQVQGGKLTQVLIGHSDHVTCVAVAISDKAIVVSGSRDANLIVWDINTGNDVHTLRAHLGYVTCVKLTGDGSLAVSGSEDKSVIVWDTKRGRALSSLQLHVPVLGLEMSTDSSRIAVHLLDVTSLPIVCLHNTPATYVKMPAYVAPANDVEDLRPSGPKRPMRRLLKKEVSLDTYTWQKKYGHLTSSIMMAAVDERLKRRFSVSASMEEISKIPAKGGMGSQGMRPEAAALAQSQHFDQLEALWNKHSPPRRRHNQTLSKQNSRSSRRDSSDTGDERTPGEEIVGALRPALVRVRRSDPRLTQSCITQ